MQPRRVIVIGGSAGAIDALKRVLPAIPSGLPAALAIVVHIPPGAPSRLAEVLGKQTSLDTHTAVRRQQLESGHLYVAPPDHHLVVVDGVVDTVHGPRENNHRPAIDALFRTAAAAWGPRTIGVLLSGTGDDGTAGLKAVKAAGGVAIVQDPGEAIFRGMPASARDHVAIDHSVRAGEIGLLLARLVTTGQGDGKTKRERAQPEDRMQPPGLL